MRAFDSDVLVEALSLSERPVVFLLLGLFCSKSSILKLFDLRVEVGLVGRPPDILKSGVVDVVLDIVADGVVEKSWLLADYSKGTSEVMDIIIFDIDAVDQYFPSCHIVEPLQQLVDG